MMKKKILVIDGMYLIFSSFYVNRNLKTLNGDPSGAIFGFVNRVEYLIKKLEPDLILVALDSKEDTFRKKLYPQYKANRDLPPEELVAQIEPIKEYLRIRGIKYILSPGFEADDIIANLAFALKDSEELTIFTADKDLFQLVAENVFVFHPKLKIKLNRDGIKEIFGIFPEQIVDYLSLTGDSSDNIPGVPGIGDKGAKKLLKKHGSLDKILNGLSEVEERYRKKIEQNMDLLKLSRNLVDLKKAPEFGINEEEYVFKSKPDQRLIDFYKRFSFNSLLKNISVKIDEKDLGIPGIQYNFVLSKNDLSVLKEKILEEKFFSFDIETTGLDFFDSEIVGVSISFKDSGYYIPFIFPDEEKNNIKFNFNDFKELFGDIFSNEKIGKSGHNIKFDALQLKSAGIQTKGIFHDSMIMSYLIFPNRRSHKLKELSYEYTGYKQTGFDELLGSGKQKKKISEISYVKTGKYCIDDSILSLKLIEIFKSQLSEKDLMKLYKEVEIPLINVLIDMEYEGVKIDVDFFKRSGVYLRKELNRLEKEIIDAAGYEININSSQQLGIFLFEEMNLPSKKKTKKTGVYSTDIKVLEELRGIPIVDKIIEFRSYKKLLSTYLEGILDNIDSKDRVHTSYNQTVAATGRLSSSHPNLQNIPVGESAGISVRKGFVSGEGRRFLAADYSQVELRVMAHFSDDKNLKEAFFNDFDIHKFTADKVFGGNLFLTDQERRKRAKIINFSILYGSGPFSLSKELGVSFKEAKNFIDTYFEKYSGVREFMDNTIEECEKSGKVKTILGRERNIPEINSSNRNIKENGKRMAVNTVIQGSAADIIKLAMINIFPKIEKMKAKMVMQVHDELIFEYHVGEEEILKELVISEMENAFALKVPLKVKAKTGENWGMLE